MASVVERLDWATGKQWDAAEGLLPVSELPWVVAQLQGWADLCSDADRAQYLALARQVQCLVESLRAA